MAERVIGESEVQPLDLEAIEARVAAAINTMDFDAAWAATKRDYGEDALEQVRMGWDLAIEEIKRRVE